MSSSQAQRQEIKNASAENGATHSDYVQRIKQWRKEREDALVAPDGWLSLVGLFMLAEGEYTLGSGEENPLLLPSSAPAALGKLSYRAGTATLEVKGETPVLVDGVPQWSVAMVDNRNNRRPTMVKIGPVSFNLHSFGDEVALRVRDSSSPAIQQFGGCHWYEIKPEYCVAGQLVRESAPAPIAVSTSVKTVAHYQRVGTVEFEVLGQPLTLLASATTRPDELFIIFRDATAGRETYGAGRYLYAPLDNEDRVLLDFNKAYFPPCAFTPYATCSLPPVQNILQAAIEAGERY